MHLCLWIRRANIPNTTNIFFVLVIPLLLPLVRYWRGLALAVPRPRPERTRTTSLSPSACILLPNGGCGRVRPAAAWSCRHTEPLPLGWARIRASLRCGRTTTRMRKTTRMTTRKRRTREEIHRLPCHGFLPFLRSSVVVLVRARGPYTQPLVPPNLSFPRPAGLPASNTCRVYNEKEKRNLGICRSTR